MTFDIRRVLLALLLICVAGSPQLAWGHGSPIFVTVVDGKLSGSGTLQDDRGYAEVAFADPDEEAVFTPAPGNRLITSMPGFNIFDMSAGQQLWLEVLPRPDFTKPSTPSRWLWYSDATGSAVADAPATLKLDLSSSRGFTPNVSLFQSTAPTATSVKLAELLGSDFGPHLHLLNYILNDVGAAAGTYGFFVRLTSPDYAPSEPFLLTLNNGLDAETFQRGAKLINAAARLPGDYDGDEDVDGTDFLTWQRTLGSTINLRADGSINDVVDAADLDVWSDNFGRVSPAGTAVAVAIPEPSSLILGACFAGMFATVRRTANRA